MHALQLLKIIAFSQNTKQYPLCPLSGLKKKRAVLNQSTASSLFSPFLLFIVVSATTVIVVIHLSQQAQPQFHCFSLLQSQYMPREEG